MWRIVAVGLVGMMSACATLGEPPVPSKPVAVFPSPAELAAIESRSGEVPAVPTADVPADGWTFDSSRVAATPALPWAPEGPWDQAFARAFTKRGLTSRLTRAMSCVAGELGRFQAEHGAIAPEALERFVSAACGVTDPAVATRFLTVVVAQSLSDEALLARHGAALGPAVVDPLPSTATEVGFWFGRRGDRVIALAAFGVAPVELASLSVVTDAGGALTIEGRVLADADASAAYVNQGRFGVIPCLSDPGVSLPRFRVTCRLAKDDQTAWIQVDYTPKGTVLALPLVQVLARRDAQSPLRFLEPPPATPHVATSIADFRATMLVGLNAVRAQAALPPVRLAAAQSESASRIARPYFAASMGAGNPKDLNTVVLGMMAGWQVQGMIRSGGFYAVMLPNTRDVARWLDYAMALPMGRVTLLDRDIEEIACGPTFLADPRGVGAIVTSYRFQHDSDHAAEIAALHARIQAMRQRRGLPPAPRIRDADVVIAEALARVRREERSPMEAMYESMQGVLGNVQRNVRGLVYEATSVDAVELPPALLDDPSVRYELGVTHHKPPGSAWSQLVIVFVYVSTPRIRA